MTTIMTMMPVLDTPFFIFFLSPSSFFFLLHLFVSLSKHLIAICFPRSLCVCVWVCLSFWVNFYSVYLGVVLKEYPRELNVDRIMSTAQTK